MSFAFQFGPAGGATTAPPQSAAPAAKAPVTAQQMDEMRISMLHAFKDGGNVDLFEKSDYEKPGTYLEKIEEVKFHVSKNKGKGTEGQAYVICKRKIIRVLWHDPNLGPHDTVGNTTVTRYALSKGPAYASCVQFMSKVCDIHHKSLTRENMVEICMPSQMFAGVTVVTARYFLPLDPVKKAANPGLQPFLTCYYKGRIDSDELMIGAVPEMGGPLTQQELDRFYGGKRPVDPFWVVVQKAENWARGQNANLPTDAQKAAFTPEQMNAYFDQLVGAYTAAKAQAAQASAPVPSTPTATS
jgi:hypothetical protein